MDAAHAEDRIVTSRSTIDYYNRNAAAYYTQTSTADVAENCIRFAKYVRPHGSIVDIGCGSGRDIAWFREAGFKASGIDASAELCHLAREHTGAEIRCVRIQDWMPAEQYDGIWANASLLHLTPEEIQTFIARLPALLTQGGVAYLSFKSGIETGMDATGRYYTDMSQETLTEILAAVTGLEIVDQWESADALHRDTFTWLNVIVTRNAMRILMLGNSYTFYNDLPNVLAALTGAEVVAHTRGGAHLAEQCNPATEMGARTQAALQNERWDYVVLQEYSNGPITSPAQFRQNTTALCEQARAAGATPVLYATWAYQQGGRQLTSYGMNYDEMYRRMHEAYARAAEDNAALMADVGTRFYERTGEDIYAPDGSHPNAAGTQIAAECIAETIMNHHRLSFPRIRTDMES